MKQEITKHYELLEKRHCWHIARRRIISEVIRTHLKQHPPSTTPKLLDIGCGPGVTLAHMQKEFSCTGVEPIPEFIRLAHYNSNATILKGSLPNQLPNFHSKFDILLLLDVLEHIQDDLSSLKAACDLLTPNGIIIINVPALPLLWSQHDEVNEHKRRYTKKSILDLISKTNLKIQKIQYWSNILVPFFIFERIILDKYTSRNRYRIPPRSINYILEKIIYYEYKTFKNFNIPFGLNLLIVASL